jgi:hypothetical protein
MLGDFPPGASCIQNELETAFARLTLFLEDDAKTLLDAYLPRLGVDAGVPPAFVLFSARLSGGADRAILPAMFLTLIHLGMTMHAQPRQFQDRDRQLVILEGDYLYAHLFHLLCETDCLPLLGRLSRLIREMSEGSVMRWFPQQQDLPGEGANMALALGKQYGRFFAECCELGGLFAGRHPDEALLLRRFGHEFGMAYGMKETGRDTGIYAPFLARALDNLGALQPASGKSEMEEFARGLLAPGADSRFRAAG